MAAQDNETDTTVTLETYRPSEYEDAAWEKLCDVSQVLQFTPAEFPQVQQATCTVDSMFANFEDGSASVLELSREAGDFELHEYGEPDYSSTSEADGGGDSVESSSQNASEVGERGLLGEAVDAYHQGGSSTVDGLGGVSQAQPADSDGKASHPLAGAVSEDGRRNFSEGEHGAGAQELIEAQRLIEERYRLLWEDMQTQLDEALRMYEARAVELALSVAKRLVGSIVEGQREYICQVIHDALHVAAGAEVSAVRVSPQDYEFLKLKDYGDVKKIISGKPIEFISDESIRAGCILVTTAGEVDFNLDTLWNQIYSKIVQEPAS